jgi:hypothetical protein
MVVGSGSLILGVPDSSQPADYGVAGYGNWCAPEAAADLLGYWEDVRGCVGLTDRQVSPASPAYPATAGTWQQGLWHDGSVELGWFMDTGFWQTLSLPFPPNAGSTLVTIIGPGTVNYARSGWTDAGTGIAKVGYGSASTTKDTVLNQAMWTKYVSEINAGNPVLVSFDAWVQVPGGLAATVPVNGQSVDEYNLWTSGPSHCVCAVGYIDPTPTVLNGDEWMIVQDNNASTSRYVAVPLGSAASTHWLQNRLYCDTGTCHGLPAPHGWASVTACPTKSLSVL